MPTFQLHPRLQQDCILLGQLPLSQVLLMNDSQYPWCILVPRVADITEIYQLSHQQRQQLADESALLAKMMAEQFQPDKMNVANIGNKVMQLHIHHIARYQHDKAWPEPIWGKFPAVPYTDKQLQAVIAEVLAGLRQVSELAFQVDGHV
jgi:diadenosine tetraphosphate (Ap4A) HIT family hydrolase